MTDSVVHQSPIMGRIAKFCTIKVTGRVLDVIVLVLGSSYKHISFIYIVIAHLYGCSLSIGLV